MTLSFKNLQIFCFCQFVFIKRNVTVLFCNKKVKTFKNIRTKFTASIWASDLNGLNGICQVRCRSKSAYIKHLIKYSMSEYYCCYIQYMDIRVGQYVSNLRFFNFCLTRQAHFLRKSRNKQIFADLYKNSQRNIEYCGNVLALLCDKTRQDFLK